MFTFNSIKHFNNYFLFKIREYVDGSDLETLMKNPSLCPALRSPEERIKMAVGIAKVRIAKNESSDEHLILSSGLELSSQSEDANCSR